MAYECRVELDSISPAGRRLITLVVTYPRIVHAELMTHRAFERNAASSRAIPFKTMLRQVMDDPFIPIKWGAEQKGMQTAEELSPMVVESCLENWMISRDKAVEGAAALHKCGLHKSLCNRLLEPFSWITVVITATEWENFFRLRCHPAAEVHLQKIAYMMRDAIAQSEPNKLGRGQWHTPFIRPDDLEQLQSMRLSPSETEENICKISTARCARVSYLTHDGIRDINRDFELFERLASGVADGIPHASPFGHIATPFHDGFVNVYSGPFKGWFQYRKSIKDENAETPLYYKPSTVASNV